MVLAGNWLEGNLGNKNIFHGEKKHEDRQTIPDVDKMSKKENNIKQEGSVDSNLAKEQKQNNEAKPGDFKGPPKYNESSQGEAKENCNPRESQEIRNDMEDLTIASDCNSFLSSETHSQSPGLPPEDQSSSENIQNTEYNHRCLQIDNLDNQYYSPGHSCDNQQHPPARTLGQQVARCGLTRSMYNF